MARNILHVDFNSFYASVEMQRHPELRDKPVAVCGDPEARHGIVLTANYLAKPRGVKTGMAIWQAKQHCPDLVIVPPDMDEYIRISKLGREIYEDYTDQIEPFGLDCFDYADWVFYNAGGYNNVDITGVSGFTSVARPVYYGE